MKAEIEVIRPGLFSTIQDMGRPKLLSYGVPLSGVMDRYAAKMGNLLLQNSANAAVLEITLTGPRLLFQGPATIAITGANLSPSVNGAPVDMNSVIKVATGDELSFGRQVSGCRSYLAICGGFRTEKVLGSRSWYEGITAQFKLERGDKISFKASEAGEVADVQAALKVKVDYMTQAEVQAYPGPEYHLLSGKEKRLLHNSKFSVGKNMNRMAIQLKEEFRNDLEPILTGPVLPGTVQLTPSGRLIALMQDCQTTGGYPRVLQISNKGMNTLSQKLMGAEVQFRLERLE